MFSNGKHSTVRGSISGSFGAISFILNSKQMQRDINHRENADKHKNKRSRSLEFQDNMILFKARNNRKAKQKQGEGLCNFFTLQAALYSQCNCNFAKTKTECRLDMPTSTTPVLSAGHTAADQHTAKDTIGKAKPINGTNACIQNSRPQLASPQK